MTKAKSGIRFTAIAVAAILLLSGCIPGVDGDPEGDVGLYLGPLPPPAELPPAPDLPPRPAMPTDTSDQAAMDAYKAANDVYAQAFLDNQDKVVAHYEAMRGMGASTAMGGKDAVATWQSLLVTAGIAVYTPQGDLLEVDGQTGFGWAMTDAQLRLHSVLGAAQGGLRLVDLADALSGGLEISGTGLAEAVHDSLSGVDDEGFAKVLASVQPELLYSNGQVRPLEEVFLSWATVGLVLHRLSAELAVSDSGAEFADDGAAASPPNHPIALAAYPGKVNAAAGARACEVKLDNPWAAELVNQMSKAHAFVFDAAIGYLDSATDTKKRTSIGGKIGIARLISALYTVYAKAASLDATFSMDDAPLVRTKNTQIGEIRDLMIAFRFDKDSWEDIRGCMNLFLAPFGLDVQGSQAGVAESIDVQLASDDPSILRIGDGKGGNTDVTRGRTDGSGRAEFTVSGAPQLDILPDVAEPEDLSVTLRAVTNLGANDFYKDIASLPWDALDAAGTGGLSLVPLVLSRMELITQTGSVPVRDWKLEADFEATVLGTFTERSATHNRTQNTCGGGWDIRTGSTDVSSSFATDAVAVSAVLLSNPDGNLGDQAAVFVPTGDHFSGRDAGDGVWMFDLPVHYQTEKNYSEPAVGPVPPEKVRTGGGCADGGYPGEWVPPTPDCGSRQYAGMLSVTIPAPGTLYAGANDHEDPLLWKECGGLGHPVAGVSTTDCEPRRSGGRMPALSDIFDSSQRIIEIDGALACSETREGYLYEIDYEWTLVLCRIVDGESAC